MASFVYTMILTVAACSCAADVSAQDRTASQTSAANKGGASTGAQSRPVYDSHHRPITAGGFVATGPRLFEDVARQAGLATWRHTLGSAAKDLIVETDGSGVALLDYDNDGWLDIYLVNGSTREADVGRQPAPQAALFHNNRDGTFTNLAAMAGVTNDRWGYGAAVGDFDNDGWPDIYVTNLGKNRLYLNNHDGTFTDVAGKAGVDVDGWSMGATFGDYDGDGRLDLFVPGYVQFDPEHPPRADTSSSSFHTCQFRSVPVSCGPRGLKGAPDHLFHNNGDGTFTDVSRHAGVEDPQGSYGFTGLFVDVDGDGKPDLLVANDSTPNYLYINQGDGTFKEQGIVSGFAFNREGREVASMGLAVGDLLNDGAVDAVITNFSDDYKLLLRNDGHGNFDDVSEQFGLAENTMPFLGWGVGLFDYDNDGWKDLMMFNGHVYPVADKMPWGTSYSQRPLLFHNRHGKAFDLIPPLLHSGLASVTSARGAAFGDLFNDGKISAVVNNLDQTPTLLRNVSPDKHAWVELKLLGGPRSPRDAVGAKVFLRTRGITQRQDILSGGSFLSSNDQRAHFGLGDFHGDAELTIRWPSGNTERLTLKQPNTIYTVAEGKGVVSAMAGAQTGAGRLAEDKNNSSRPHTVARSLP